jgi:hypothetical protein
MITVEYTYTCDFCREPIAPPEVTKISAKVLPPQPAIVSTLGRWHVCESCAAVAKRAISESLDGKK